MYKPKCQSKRKSSCQFCGERFQRLDMHEPKCRSKPKDNDRCADFVDPLKHDATTTTTTTTAAAAANDDDNDEGKFPCQFCGERFKRLAMHEPKCRSKPKDPNGLTVSVDPLKFDSTDDDDDDDGKSPCPFCGERFKRLAMHEPKCRSKPKDPNGLTVPVDPLKFDSTDDDDDDDGKSPCPFCGERFKRLAMHEPKCRSKPKDPNGLTVPVDPLKLDSTDDDDDDGKSPCPFCGERFKRLAMHEPKCRSKPKDPDGLPVNHHTTANGNSPCQFLVESFPELGLHEPKCQVKSNDNDRLSESLDSAYMSSFDSCSASISEPEYGNSLLQNLTGTVEEYTSFIDFKKSVQLKRLDLSLVRNINDLLSNILRKLKSDLPLNWDQLNTGSYYSNVKVSKPNEFDYMLFPKKVECKIEPYEDDICYCRVFVENKTDLPLDFQKILTLENELTPSKFKDYVFEAFDSATSSRQITRVEMKSTCPAYTIRYEYTSNTCKEADIDLVPCLLVHKVPDVYKEWKSKYVSEYENKKGDIYVVPKRKAVGNKELELWRLSYSVFEKMIIGKKCETDDRSIIRILKKIREEVKDEDSNLCSYHIVTSCLHLFEKTKNKKKLEKYTLKAIDFLIGQLESHRLPHFFIPEFNLLKDVEESECQKFIQRLNHYKNMWINDKNKKSIKKK